MVSELFGSANINALLGVMNAAFVLTGSVAPVLAGLRYDIIGSFQAS